MQSPPKSREQVSIWVSWTNIGFNALLAAFKLFAGIFANSQAMISDAIHTLSDMLTTFLVIAGIRLGARKADASHQYGHERFENVAAILLSVILAVTGVLIGWAGITRIMEAATDPIPVPGLLALIAALVGIAMKEGMYWRTRHYAKKLNSSVLMADAWHNRSDSLSSIGSFVAILGARLGFPVLDPLASVVICFFILKAAVDVFRDAVNKMTDHAVDEKTAVAIRTVVLDCPGVRHLDVLYTRAFGDRIFVDIEISVDGDLPLHEAHEIAQQVHNRVEAEFPNVKHCMVHMNPAPRPPEECNPPATSDLQSEGGSDKMDETK
ncbi:MAG: cation diffusion facilitator family transporter [Oscillospiraceae bacterium]|nr:cation diffusion facilitator family transporter [Oscillospiraceae bacterium]